jgi:hypothetical protein
MAAAYGEGTTMRCPLCRNVFTTGQVDEEAAEKLTSQLTELAHARLDVELLFETRSLYTMTELQRLDERQLSELEMLIAIGGQKRADAVLTGHVFRYVERVGGRYSIESPASALFDLDLIRVPDGRLLWYAAFDETQQALLDNVLKLDKFLERKGGWLTAEELSYFGLKKVLDKLPLP